MQDRRKSLKPALALGVLLALGASGAGAQGVSDGAACRGAMIGTWLTTIETTAGDFASRSLVAIHADGTLSVVDSAQHQGLQGSSFSAQLGAWRCTGAASGTATTLNFGFPERATIARSDWTLGHDGKGLTGSIALSIFPGVKGVDPFRTDAKPVETFRFTSVRVSAP